MMEKYKFEERNSYSHEKDGENFRRVYFRGKDPDRELNVDGVIEHVPEKEYFEAGLDDKLEDLIREFVIGKLTEKDDGSEKEEDKEDDEDAE